MDEADSVVELERSVAESVRLRPLSSSYTSRTSCSFAATWSGLTRYRTMTLLIAPPPSWKNRSVSGARDYTRFLADRKPIGTIRRWQTNERDRGARGRAVPRARDHLHRRRRAQPRRRDLEAHALPALRQQGWADRRRLREPRRAGLPDVHRPAEAATDDAARAARPALRPARALVRCRSSAAARSRTPRPSSPTPPIRRTRSSAAQGAAAPLDPRPGPRRRRGRSGGALAPADARVRGRPVAGARRALAAAGADARAVARALVDAATRR